MKKKFFASFLCVTLLVALVGCGNNTAGATAEPAPAPKEEVVEEPVVELEVPETPETEIVEVSEPEKPTEPEVSKKEEESTPEEPAPEEPAKEESTPEEIVEEPEPTIDELIAQSAVGEYIVDGRFNFTQYGYAAGASDVKNGKVSFLYIFGNQYIMVQVGTDDGDPNTSCVSIGNWDTNDSRRWNLATYSYLFDTGETMPTEVDGLTVAKQSLMVLPSLIDWLKTNQTADVAPQVSGADFRPCDKYDDITQH